MKTIAVTLVSALAASVAAVPGAKERRQMMDIGALMGTVTQMTSKIPPGYMAAAGKMMNNIVPKIKAMKIEEITPVIRKDAKRIRLTYGPYKLKSAKGHERVGNSFSFDPQGTGYMNIVDKDFPKDITILDTKSFVADEDFQPTDIAKGVYNHHNVFYDWTSPLPFLGCPGDNHASSGIPVTLLIAGATEQLPFRYTSNDGKFNSGYYLAKDAVVANMIDVVNYNNVTKTVYTISELEYVPGKIQGALPAFQDVVDLGKCTEGMSGLGIHPPAGQSKFTVKGNPMEIGDNGYIVNMRAHLHDGGVNMIVKLNDEEICDSKAVYGGEGHEGMTPSGKKWASISDTTTCDTAVAVKKGDKLTMEGYYDLDEHVPRESPGGHDAEDMALLLATFAKGP